MSKVERAQNCRAALKVKQNRAISSDESGGDLGKESALIEGYVVCELMGQ